MSKQHIFVVLLLICSFEACTQNNSKQRSNPNQAIDNKMPQNMENLEQATLGGGCFWCVEAIYESVEGVLTVEPGYSGGMASTANYKMVCSGKTKHVEVIQITFDPQKINFAEILDIFWASHNPTTLNRQGNDIGTQYRSVIFCQDESQEKIAKASIQRITDENLWEDPILTAIESFDTFFIAENYHNNYYKNNKDQPYCQAIISPKIQKFRKKYKHKLKANIED